MTRRVMIICGALLCLLYGISTATHLLAFLGRYRLETFLIAAPLAVLGAAGLYARTFLTWTRAVFPPHQNALVDSLSERPLIPARQRRLAAYDRACLMAALILLLLIFLLRVSLFPWSNVGDLVSTDAIGYHFPKSLELVRSGTMWDVSFLYAEYPIGYEGLVAASVLLTGTVFGAGLLQTATILLLIPTLALLICRYSDLPIGLSLLTVTGLFLHPSVYGLLLLIGKNDLLMTTAILAAVLHSPLTIRGRSTAFHPVGVAMATMLAMSVKATAFVPLALLWLLMLWAWGQRYWQAFKRRPTESPLRNHMVKDGLNFIGLMLLMLPAGFWLIRNLVMMHRPFSPDVSSFFQGSLLYNLTFPKLYSDGPESTTLIILAVWGMIFIGLALWRGGWRMALLLAAFWVGFLITPLGAFHTPERHTVRIEWRYITHLFLFMAVFVITACAPVLNWALEKSIRKPLWVALALIMLCGGILVYIDPISSLLPRAANVERLINPYSEVHAGDVVSVYDYVRRFVTHSIVYYNGMERFYFYIPQETNRFMDVTPHPLGMPDLVPRPIPDYFVQRKAALVPKEEWPLWGQYVWDIVYEDSFAVVYRRRDPA